MKQASSTIVTPGMTDLYKLLRKQYPAFQNKGPRQQDIESICKTLANVVDKLGPIRNQASLAHPQERFLDEPDTRHKCGENFIPLFGAKKVAAWTESFEKYIWT